MRMLGLFLVLGLLVASTTAEDTRAKKDLEQLQGKWKLNSKVTRASIEGTSTEYGLFLVFANKGTLVIKGDKLITRRIDAMLELTMVIDPSKSPKTLDVKTSRNQIVFRGIYEVGKTSLRLCISGKGDRPTEFKDTWDTPVYVYKRE